jgi:hypothetical protein
MSLTGSFYPDNLIGGDKKVVTEEVLVPSGNNLTRGTVVGRQRVSVPTTGTADGGNTGNGTCTVVTGGPQTKKGTYTVECIIATANGGTFKIVNPDGDNLGTVEILGGAGGTGVFGSPEINLTLTDGSTDFAVGDKFTVAVSDGVPTTGTADGGNTGNGTVTLVEGRSGLMIGTYTIECTAAVTNGGVFKVTNPDGNVVESDITIPPGAGNYIDFSNDELAGRITDGSTDFVVGDKFTVAVTINPRQVVACDKTATDGSSVPYGVLLQDLDATSAAKTGIAALEGQFNERQLVFASGTDVEDVRDQMRDLGMIVVPSEPA